MADVSTPTEALPRRLRVRRPGRAASTGGLGGAGGAPAASRADRVRTHPPQARRTRVAGGREARRPGEVEAGRAPLRRPCPPQGRRPRRASTRSPRTISAGATTACSRSRRPRTATCAACASRTASSTTISSPASRTSPNGYGGGYAHVTTRANLQVREIEAGDAARLPGRPPGPRPHRPRLGRGQHPQRHRLADRRHRRPGDRSTRARSPARGTSTSSTTARSTACRASSTSPSTAAASSPVLEETNDIGFQAVTVREGAAVEAGLGCASSLGGITGHRDLARDTRRRSAAPTNASPVADAIVRVFIENGDRTEPRQGADEIRARRLGLRQVPRRRRGEARPVAAAGRAGACRAAPADRPLRPYRRAPAEAGRPNWIGVVLPVGRLTADQMRGLAATRRATRRRRYPPDRLAEPAPLRRPGRARGGGQGRASTRSGLDWRATSIRAGLVACTGSRAASSRPPTPRAQRSPSPSTSRRGSRSTCRSTSTSPAATIPAPSTTSATSA